MMAIKENVEKDFSEYGIIKEINIFFFQWLFQPMQGTGLLFSSVFIFHRR
jgi:hypothetical protein